MSKEILTHSESYVKKTNRIILVVGITSFVIFVLGVMLLMQSGPVQDDYTEPVFTDNDDALTITSDTGPMIILNLERLMTALFRLRQRLIRYKWGR